MNEQLLLGNQMIDHQHQALLQSFARLSAVSERDHTDETLSDILSELTRQIHHHFQTEEELMASLNLPDDLARLHHAAHSQILEEVAQIHIEAMGGRKYSFPEIIHTVDLWVQQHLIQFDLSLKPYIAALAAR